jgi:transmembrane sensor
LRTQHEAWLAESEAHVRAFRKAEKVWHLTGAVPPAYADQWADDDAREIMPAWPSPTWRRRPGWAVGLVLGAAAACLAFAILLPDLQVRLQADYSTGVGERRQVTLADGSSVHLDADSAISVSSAPTVRAVRLLAGQAFFEVVPDRARPFTVAAEDMTVTVVGTAFDVQVMAGSLVVAVQSGTVEAAISRDGQLTTARLAPGDRLTVARVTGTVVRDGVAPSQIASWRTGRLIVDGATVAQVIDEIRRHHRGVILLQDKGLAERHVTGVFDLHDPAGALRALIEPYAGRVVELTPYVLVIAAR